MDKDQLAERLLAVLTRMVTFFASDDYKAAKFGLEQAIKASVNKGEVDLAAPPEKIMREVHTLALAYSAQLPVTRKTKAVDLSSIAKAPEILNDAFREELPE
ncbi:MAG: hypothetical protein NVSMB31_00550 [Vulcanimicrobiaceae bacterium]